MTLEEDIPPVTTTTPTTAPDSWDPLRRQLAPHGVILHRWRPIPGVVSCETATQHAWFLQLMQLYPKADVRFEPFVLQLPDRSLYTVSLNVIQEPDSQVIGVYEVHGKRPEDRRSYAGFLKAQAAIPIWDFQYVRKTRQGWVISPDRESSFSQPDRVLPLKNKAKGKAPIKPASR